METISFREFLMKEYGPASFDVVADKILRIKPQHWKNQVYIGSTVKDPGENDSKLLYPLLPLVVKDVEKKNGKPVAFDVGELTKFKGNDGSIRPFRKSGKKWLDLGDLENAPNGKNKVIRNKTFNNLVTQGMTGGGSIGGLPGGGGFG